MKNTASNQNPPATLQVGVKSHSQTRNKAQAQSNPNQSQHQAPHPKTSKNLNRRNQLLSMGNGGGNAQQVVGNQQSSQNSMTAQQQMMWQQHQMQGSELGMMGGLDKQNSQKGNHMRTATMAPGPSGTNSLQMQNQQKVVQKDSKQQPRNKSKSQPGTAGNATLNPGAGGSSQQAVMQQDGSHVGHHQKNLTMSHNIQQQSSNNAMMSLGSPLNNFAPSQAGKGQGTGGKLNSRRAQQQSNLAGGHHRGRSSGIVMQNQGPQVALNQTSEINQILQAQHQMLANANSQHSAAANQLNFQFNSTQNPGQSGQGGSNNPFRRQKQQAKYQQKYQQQLQMYSSSNRILNNQQNKQKSAAKQQAQHQQMLQEAQQQQQMINYNNHVRSLSNCSNQFNQNYVQQNLMNIQTQLQAQQAAAARAGGDHRKAPSSISLLNQTQLSGNMNGSNLQMPGIPGVGGPGSLQGRPNIANVANMGNIAMTHQNLLIQPQISQNLIQQATEEKITEQQILESEEYFESGKLFLTDKKYKDASKMFTKSLLANKTNYDALFYRAVTNLDQELPEKAISDLEELMKICSDYRKTMFIVLSIAYRRVNDYLSAIRTLSKAIHKYPAYLEAYIARGQIYIFQKKWDKALNDFKTVLKYSPSNGMGYLGQGDSFKGLGQIEEAVKSYSRVIELDPQTTSQGLMKRGLLYLQLRKNEEALKDFNQLTQMAEDQNQDFTSTSLSKAYFYKAKALKKMNNMNDSVLYFEQVLRLGEDNFISGSALYEIAKIKIQQKDFYEAHYNLQRTVHLNLRQKKLQNYKIFTEGVIFLMKRKTKTGVKLLSQVIDRMKSQSINSPNIKKIEASAAERNSSGNHKSESQNSIESQNSRNKSPMPDETQGTLVGGDEKDYIFPLLFIYRAYGYIILEEYDKGLKDFLKSSQIKKLNNSQHYNMILCQGLKNLEQKEFENAITFFTKAAQKQSKKRDPYLLRAISIVEYTISKPIKPKTKIQMLKDAKKDMNRALEHSPKDEQVLFLRGILNFALHRFYDAICDFERVIEKTDETNALHYLARGRCYACLSMFKEAITDLSIAINLNKDLIDAYLNRGKCAYLIGDTGLAFMDFQKLIVLEPKNPSVHIYAGNLLMTTGSYEDATKAFTNADNIKKSPLALYQRSRCHVALNNMKDALADLNKVIEISHTDKVAIQDRECLNALKTCSLTEDQIKQQTEKDFDENHDKATFLKSAQALTKLISYEKNENLSKIVHESSIQHQHSQVIPSAHRTKMDKIRAIRRRKDQDRVQRENPDAGRKNDLRFRVQQGNDDGNDEDGDEYEDISELDEREIERLNRKLARNDSDELDQGSSDDEEDNEQGANYYKENIFNKEDFYLYRSVLFIYGEEYEKATSDLEQCSSIMHQNKELYPKNHFSDKDLEDGYESPTGTGNVNGQNDDNMSNGSSQTDLSDVGLCSLNIHEFSFNTALCLILANEYAQALSKLDFIIDTIAKKYVNEIWLIRGVMNEILGYKEQAVKDFKRAHKYDKQNAVKFLDQGQDVYLSIFPQQQRLCSFFQYIPINISDFKGSRWQSKGQARIHLKPSFSFPFIKPPNMIPCVDQNVVLEQYNLKKSNVQLKPEAPWIKKCQFGIKFTEEILYTDDDREPTPDDEKEYKKRKQRQQERAMEGAGFIRAHSEKVELRNNIFAEDNGNVEAEVEEALAQEAGEGQGDEQYIYTDENGNRIDLAELADFEDMAQLAELENMQGIDQNLANHLKMLKEAQKKQQQQNGQGHNRNKTQAAPPPRRNDMDIDHHLGLDDQMDDEEYDSSQKGSPVPDFNKLQNISNLKDIAKQVAQEVPSVEDYNDRNYMDDMEDEPSPTAKFRVTEKMQWSGSGLRSKTTVVLNPDGSFACSGYVEENQEQYGGAYKQEQFAYKGKFSLKEQGKSVHFYLRTTESLEIKAILSDDVLKIVSDVPFHTELTRKK